MPKCATSCKTCQKLCCASLRITGYVYAGDKIVKRAGDVCPHLDCGGKCLRYDDRPWNACALYDCGGAGEYISELFRRVFPEFKRTITEDELQKMDVQDRRLHEILAGKMDKWFQELQFDMQAIRGIVNCAYVLLQG